MDKIYVKVRCSHLPDGTIRPESMEWMAAQVGVSFSAMQIRLRELELLEYHPLDEYLKQNLLGGGVDERLYL